MKNKKTNNMADSGPKKDDAEMEFIERRMIENAMAAKVDETKYSIIFGTRVLESFDTFEEAQTAQNKKYRFLATAIRTPTC